MTQEQKTLLALVPAARVDYARHDLVCVVDGQPATGYCSLPAGVRADVIFDHHPLREPTPGIPFAEIDETAGIVGRQSLLNFSLQAESLAYVGVAVRHP